MKRLIAAAAAALCAATPALAACDTQKIEAALAASLDAMKPHEREVSDVQSTEGGVWRIYREKDGRLNTVMRIDGGESGMGERRLSVVNRKTYGIAVTRVDYLRHAFIENAGPNGTARRTTDYYYFCDGKLLVPPREYFGGDAAAYAAAGAEAQKAMLSDSDVAEFTKGLAR
jgi:hypothetical protein